VLLVGAGRTDAGVHALGQVASFEMQRDLPPERLERMLNSRLPPDVRVLRVQRAPAAFSARHSAVARCYRYQMARRPSAVRRRYFFDLEHRVDIEAMNAAAGWLLGDQDFTAFVASDAGPSCRCLVSRAVVHEHDDELVYFDITANRFLHNMVRRLSGALVEVGRGRLSVAGLRDVLRNRDRSRGGPCLPPQGLYLMEVRYPRPALALAGEIDA
jgi:tRNA pseudouridine38-40 synthase